MRLTVNPEKAEVVLFTRKYKTSPVSGLKLFGKEIKVSKEAKYLGVVLDSKLNWSKHLEYACGKVTQAYWACRKAFGPTWGLGPDKVRWLYTAVLRPRLVYGAAVWWPRCRLKGAKKALDKIQRMVLGGVAGCMRTTPLAACEVLLGFPPLDLWIRKIAFKAACRLQSQNSRGGQMDWELVEQLGIQAPVTLDRCSKRWFFEKPYAVAIGDRREWEGGSHELTKQGMVWFTDGSKTERGVGAAAWRQGSGIEVVCNLDTHATVFQAEVRAIAESAQAMLEGGCRGKPVVICSDSQAALGALDGYLVRSREVLRCRGLLGELSRANSVSLLWVPGHSGVIGNEKADRLANRGTRGIRSTRCSVGLPDCYLEELLEKWLKRMALKRWQEETGMRQAKLLVGERPSESWLKELGRFNRRRLRLAVGWLTGHWRVNYHLSKMGLSRSADCRWCQEEEETTEHLLCECQAWSEIRHKVLGYPCLEAGQLRELNLNSLLLLAEKINRKMG